MFWASSAKVLCCVVSSGIHMYRVLPYSEIDEHTAYSMLNIRPTIYNQLEQSYDKMYRTLDVKLYPLLKIYLQFVLTIGIFIF